MGGTAGTAGGGKGPGRGGRTALAGFLLWFAVLLPAAAFGATTTLQVTATIRPWLRFSATPLVSSYQVDAAALRRGYVDLPASLAVELATNLREDVALELVSGGPETIRVLNGGVPAANFLRFKAVAGNAPLARLFDLRILLPPGYGEGTYPLRVEVSAASL